MEFRILGPLEVRVDGRPVDVGAARQRALLTVLLLRANAVVSTDHLIEAVWDERPPETAPKVLQVYVSQLRKVLGRDRIVTQAPGYLIRVEPGELDAERFQALIREGKAAEALGLWRGQPLADFAYESFAQPEIGRLEELRASALEERIEADLARGRHGAVVSELEGLVRDYPLRERFSRQLMLALYRSGRQAEALDVYQRARRTSVEQLGIEPSPALRELERKILNQDESLGPPPVEPRPVRPGLPRIAYVGTAIVVVALAAVAVLASRNSSAGLDALPEDSVGVIDPRTNDIVAAIPVGVRPGPIAAGQGSVWVGNLGDRTLTRIHAVDRSVAATIPLDNRTPTGLAVGDGVVWVAHGLSGELSRVDSQFGRVLQTISLAGRSPTGSVALGDGYVWVAYGDSTLARIRPTSVRRAGSTLAGAIPSALVVVGRWLWVVNSGDANVQRFDSATFTEGPIRPVTVGRRPAAIAYGEGALWVANRGDDRVTRIDPSTGSGISIEVGDEPTGIAVGSGAVWVTNYGDGTVSRIDPAKNEVVRTIRIGSSPTGIVVTGGSVWVCAQALATTT
jgi:YVTN family beta-propeller protein